MQKIPTIFARQDYTQDRRLVSAEVTPGLEGVLDARSGLWVPRRKFDGVAVKLDDAGLWWLRKTVRPEQTPPEGYVKVAEHPTVLGQSHGWIRMRSSPAAQAWLDALSAGSDQDYKPGTYELVGPTINGNPERTASHILHSHAEAPIVGLPKVLHDYASLKHYFLRTLRPAGVEGIVWHNPDGRMAKLKVADFVVKG